MTWEEQFENLTSIEVNGKISVTKYRSKATGMTICLANVGGPLVNGYFCLATEAHDDDGLPHTLEHLIFLGSEDYPFKGVLDLLANRCLASGTNAWTDTDHTCYTMTNAGSEGFLQLMPVYLDHILYPTLTESGYVTEVHHINGDGEDAGVVYCEMQARENEGESIVYLNMLREMYPGDCGYKSETGGIMQNLRGSTSHAKVLSYHREFYRPENLCLVITGQVEPNQVFTALQPFEEKVCKKAKLPPHVRPWQMPVPPLPNSVVKRILYPSDDEESGMVYEAWRGPLARDQFTMTACMVLMEYLTDTAVAPLQKEFVEIDDPLCTLVRYSIIENSESTIYIFFENVPKDSIGEIHAKLIKLLEGLVKRKESFDMKRMQSVIHRRILDSLDSFETQPHETFAFLCIGDFLYGDTVADFKERFQQIEAFKKLATKDRDYWINLIQKFMLDSSFVSIEGEPSIQKMKEISSAEKNRIDAQQKNLGKVGLQDKADILQKATQTNDISAPDDMLRSVPVPNVDCIKFHPISPSNNHEMGSAVNDKFPLKGLPLMMQLDDIHTNFVEFDVLMNTECLPDDLKLYLPLFTEILLESPVIRNGEFVPHEEVITELAADTLSSDATVGVGGGRFSCGDYAQVITLSLKVEQEKYEKGVKWLQELLYQTQFTQERIKVIGSKMANDVAKFKRKAQKVIKAIASDLNFQKGSNLWASGMMRQHKFLTTLLKTIKSDPSKAIEDMNELRSLLSHSDNFRVHIAMDVGLQSTLGSLTDCWKSFMPEGLQAASKLSSPPPISKYLYDPAGGPSNGVIAGIGSVESNYLTQSTRCITSYTDPDLPPLLVLIQYLTQLEGQMWRQIRGLGLSYNYSIRVDNESGLMHFNLFKSTHLVNAYKQAKEIVDGFLSGKIPVSSVEFESAISSLIFEVIEEEKTVADATHESLLSYFRGVPQNYNRMLVKKIADVTIEEMQRVGPKYFLPLFDPTMSKIVICCHPSKVEEIKTAMKEFGHELMVLDSLEKGFLAQL
ncbi:uncharacterized protein C05D11.1-like isoform X2 [Tubulanus polymorphus]|uniref:uncharacterized protein C05D11.1-like isoform X2 n=1 Tax=Tubulanus polymorphus TaxID=672921 RepID=UPI003DA30F85